MKYAIKIKGKIKIFNKLPKQWQNVINLDKLSEQKLNDLGFFKILYPQINETQKQGDIYFNSKLKVYTYDVIDLTPEQRRANNQAKADEQISNFVQYKKAGGQQYANEVDEKIAFMMKGKTLTQAENLDKEIRAKIISIVQLIRSGDWLTARNYIDNRKLPKISEVRELFLEVRQTARDYVANKYPNK